MRWKHEGREWRVFGWRRVAFVVLFGFAAQGCENSGQSAGSCPAPLPHWYSTVSGSTSWDLKYDIALDGEVITWNGTPTDEAELVQYLDISRTMTPLPLIRFNPEKAADCAFAQRIMHTIDKHFDCTRNKCWLGSPEAQLKTPFKEGENVLPW